MTTTNNVLDIDLPRPLGYRDHSIALHQIVHLMRGGTTNTAPTEPWPDGAPTQGLIDEAQHVLSCLGDLADALASKRARLCVVE